MIRLLLIYQRSVKPCTLAQLDRHRKWAIRSGSKSCNILQARDLTSYLECVTRLLELARYIGLKTIYTSLFQQHLLKIRTVYCTNWLLVESISCPLRRTWAIVSSPLKTMSWLGFWNRNWSDRGESIQNEASHMPNCHGYLQNPFVHVEFGRVRPVLPCHPSQPHVVIRVQWLAYCFKCSGMGLEIVSSPKALSRFRPVIVPLPIFLYCTQNQYHSMGVCGNEPRGTRVNRAIRDKEKMLTADQHRYRQARRLCR